MRCSPAQARRSPAWPCKEGRGLEERERKSSPRLRSEKKTQPAGQSPAQSPKYVAVGSEEDNSLLRSNARKVFSAFTAASDDLSEHDPQWRAKRERERSISSALRRGYSPMRMFMATDEECLECLVPLQPQICIFKHHYWSFYIAVVGFPFLKEYPNV